MARQISKKPVKRGKRAHAATGALRLAEMRGQIAAISKVQAMIVFDMDGTILAANELFLRACGYTLDEIKGRHHGMLVDPGYLNSAEYRAFWARLAGAEYEAGEYRRIGKGGREIWLEASYNPILDANGRAFKIVQYARDITVHKARQSDYRGTGDCDRQGAGRYRVRPRRHDPQRQ